ncbi:MAG: glycoside hydrolase family 2 protein [Prolixibacteraceae bacterium]
MLKLNLWIIISLIVVIQACNSTGENNNSVVRQSKSLNGIWDFYPNGGDERFDIQVPSYWDAPQDFNYPMEWAKMQHGIYKKKFRIPLDMKGEQIFLKLDRISVLAKVFINGQQIGGEETGGYLMMLLPYEIDITNHLIFDGENALEFQIWGGQREEFGEGYKVSWKEKDFPEDALDGGMMLYPWGVDHYDGRRGIGSNVAIVSKPKTFIENVFVKPDLKRNTDPVDDEISVDLTVTNNNTTIQSIVIKTEAISLEGKEVKVFDDLNMTLEPTASKTISISNIKWASSEYWWPHNPHLYQLKTSLFVDSKLVDEKLTNFGMREFYVEGNIFKLNGIHINLRAESYEFSWNDGFNHGPSTAPVLSTKELTVDVQHRLLDVYKDLNMNALRIHKASGIEATYDYCDKIGLLVIDEAPFWQTQQRTDERAGKNFQAWTRQWIKVRRNHPSIIMWSVANESWGSPIPELCYNVAKEMDTTRPAYHQGIRPGNFEGDMRCVHYTGGYPETVFNTPNLYSIYKNSQDKPMSEGESVFADGWRLKDEQGHLTEKRSPIGVYDHPDLVPQAEWTRGAARIVRAMRFAELADSRSLTNWINCLEPIEADIYPQWDDMSASEIKPVVLHRPVCNTFTDKYPETIKGDAYDYWQDSHAPVAVFDVEFDKNNRLGVEPEIFTAGAQLNRELVVYNDELTGGHEIKVEWEIGSLNPIGNNYKTLKSGSVNANVAYGEKGLYKIADNLPDNIPSGTWLIFTLRTYKQGELKFEEKNRLGALLKIPEPKITIVKSNIDLGVIPKDTLPNFIK